MRRIERDLHDGAQARVVSLTMSLGMAEQETELGLGGAVEALALASAVPVEVDVELDERLPAPLESALHFVIAEAMANPARHSEATWGLVRLWR